MHWLTLLLAGALCSGEVASQENASAQQRGLASWYGEAHRGRLMANGQKFDPDQFSAASWTYPLGTLVRVTVQSDEQPARSLDVMITDRGPARQYVAKGRIIDLSKAAFKALAPAEKGLIAVTVRPVNSGVE